MRVLGIVLFPGSVISVQTAYVSRKMEFKALFKATMGAVIISGAGSIWMAVEGMGVWAMAGQQIPYYFALMGGCFAPYLEAPAGIFHKKDPLHVPFWMEASLRGPDRYPFQ